MAPTATTRSRADTAAGPPREGGGNARAHTPERAQTYLCPEAGSTLSSFLVGGVICLVNSVNERDLNLLNSDAILEL